MTMMMMMMMRARITMPSKRGYNVGKIYDTSLSVICPSQEI